MTWLRGYRFLRRALPYTMARDMGGFALFFGTYTLVQQLSRKALGGTTIAADGLASSSGSVLGPQVSTPANGSPPNGPHARQPHKSTSLVARGGEGGGAASQPVTDLAATVVSGGLSGLASYLWRVQRREPNPRPVHMLPPSPAQPSPAKPPPRRPPASIPAHLSPVSMGHHV